MPDDEDDRRRRGWLVPVAAVLLLVLVAVVGTLLLTGGDDDTPAASGRDATPARTGKAGSSAATGSTGPSEAPESSEPSESSPTEESGPPTSTPSSPEEQAPTAGSVEEFGADYYGLLPDDTAAAYRLLSPSYGSTFEEYDGFWRTIGAVDVRGVTAVDGTTVDVDLTYTSSNGSTEDETRRLFLEPTDDGYVIVDDAAV